MATVLVELYGCRVSNIPLPNAEEVDMYLNWEEWCGVADKVCSLVIFKNERLPGMLQKFIDAFNQSREDQG